MDWNEKWAKEGPRDYNDVVDFVRWENQEILLKGSPPVPRVVKSPNFKFGKDTEVYNVHDVNGNIIEIDGKSDFQLIEVFFIYKDKKY